MNQLTKVLLALAVTSVIEVVTASAQPLVTVDELGKGTFSGTPLPSGLKADPFSGIVTLAYQLPFPGVPGDVQLLEPGPTPAPLSDIIRFDGKGFLYFFSERETTDVPPFDPADVGQFPPPLAGLQTIVLFESGPEGNNGAFYSPAGGLPGDNSVGATYHFISDIVPEPTTLALAGFAAGVLTLRRRRGRTA
jgi:hypothetical protein